MLRTRYLIFDVETTGLLPRAKKNGAEFIAISDYPHILQLSFAIYDSSQKSVQKYDSYVKIPDEIVSSIVQDVTWYK